MSRVIEAQIGSLTRQRVEMEADEWEEFVQGEVGDLSRFVFERLLDKHKGIEALLRLTRTAAGMASQVTNNDEQQGYLRNLEDKLTGLKDHINEVVQET